MARKSRFVLTGLLDNQATACFNPLMSEKNPAAVALGKLGGLAGKGEAKRRDPELMRELQKKSVEKRLANKAKSIKANKYAVQTGVENS